MANEDSQGFPKLDIKAAKALRPNIHQIRIDSILGGHAPTTNFAGNDQFRASLGIDPGAPTNNYNVNNSAGNISSGLLRPVGISDISAGVIGAGRVPMWLEATPKDQLTYVYDTFGSVYTINAAITTVTGLTDLNDGGTSTGNGAEYYDNYVYFARDTTVARYGPLNGSPSWTDDYWSSTLGKAALINTSYPYDNWIGHVYPNHVMHRHSDGKLYFADVVGNQGTIHVISTTKTTVEGDTDNGSKASALTLGYGLWPMAIESYGTNIVVALFEGYTSGTQKQNVIRAKLAFWDTTSQNFNSIVWVEFPDQIITALKNVNGVLYVVSGNTQSDGFRISRFVGGYSFEEVYQSENGQPPFPGAIIGSGNRIMFGTHTDVPVGAGVVYSWGLQKKSLGQGLFCIARSTGGSSASISSLIENRLGNEQAVTTPIIGTALASSSPFTRIEVISTDYSGGQIWWSQLYKIGQPFKITKIRIPLVKALDSGSIIIPTIYTDDGSGATVLPTINSTNFGTNTQMIVLRPIQTSGGAKTADNNFWLELKWTGTSLVTVSLPITIEYELLDVDTAYP